MLKETRKLIMIRNGSKILKIARYDLKKKKIKRKKKKRIIRKHFFQWTEFYSLFFSLIVENINDIVCMYVNTDIRTYLGDEHCH